MFSFLWLTPIFLWLRNHDEKYVLAKLLPLTIVLSQGHKYGPHILLLCNSIAKDHIIKQRPKIIFELFMMILIPTLMGLTAAALYYFSQAPQLYYLPIGLLALIYTAWTYFHFSQQSFGVSKIYRNLNSQLKDSFFDKMEHLIVTILVFFVTAFICIVSNERIGFYLFFFKPLALPEYLKSSAALFCIFLYILCLILYFYKKSLCVPTFLSITQYCTITFILCTQPLYLGLLLGAIVHWTQSVYLSSTQLSIKNFLWTDRKRSLWFSLSAIIIISSVLYSAYNYIILKLPIIGHFGDSIDFAGKEKYLVSIGLIYFGLNIGLNYTHFYLDRFIYLKNPLLTKKNLNNA